MLQTVEAIVDQHGAVRLLEELHVSAPTRATLTLLDSPAKLAEIPVHGNAEALLDYLRRNPLPAEDRRSAEEIDAQIAEERNAWD